MSTLAVSATSPALQGKAEALATYLQVPIANPKETYDYLLEVSPEHLALVKTHSHFSPLIVDFQSAQMKYRCQKATLRNETLAKALGLKKNSPMTILDATAGLGRDSFILACLGFHVTLLERSPLIVALLEDGLQRAALDPALKTIIERMHLIKTDSIIWLKATTEKPDLIYLDPMFPDRKKSAAVKKEMQIFQEIVAHQEDESSLLSTALACAQKRVVVKRPRLAKSIEGPAPSFSLSGSSSRFDIYLI